MSLNSPSKLSVEGAKLSFGIAASRFNETLVDALVGRTVAELESMGVAPGAIHVVRVPGAHEVPWAAQALAQSGRYDCVIGLGVLIGGDTNHHEMVGNSVSAALQRVSLDSRLPVINGVIVVNTLAQAEARTRGEINRGAEFAQAAAEMAVLKRKFSS